MPHAEELASAEAYGQYSVLDIGADATGLD